jgi:putative hydrolase of HD superfamily
MPTPALTQQLAFLVEADRLKEILRQTSLASGARRENSAEHSWHLALMATVLTSYAAQPVDLSQVLRILLVHDLIEIDAGDTFAFDEGANETKQAREELAADRIFGLLPAGQAEEFRGLWDEFEAMVTPESRYANALDRLQPLLLNAENKGGSWRAHGIRRSQVLKRMDPIRTGMPDVWPAVMAIIDWACAEGHIQD